MTRRGICPTCGNYEQDLVTTSERVFEVIEPRGIIVDGKTRREDRPIQYPITHPTKRGPVHAVTQIKCALGHYITTEDAPE